MGATLPSLNLQACALRENHIFTNLFMEAHRILFEKKTITDNCDLTKAMDDMSLDAYTLSVFEAAHCKTFVRVSLFIVW